MSADVFDFARQMTDNLMQITGQSRAVLRVSSAAAEVGVTPEMSAWPLLGSLSESQSVDEPAGPCLLYTSPSPRDS